MTMFEVMAEVAKEIGSPPELIEYARRKTEMESPGALSQEVPPEDLESFRIACRFACNEVMSLTVEEFRELVARQDEYFGAKNASN
jgi:hypothetical protein